MDLHYINFAIGDEIRFFIIAAGFFCLAAAYRTAQGGTTMKVIGTLTSEAFMAYRKRRANLKNEKRAFIRAIVERNPKIIKVMK